MNILQINSSARREGATSTRIADALSARILERHDGAVLRVRDLARTPVAPLDEAAVVGGMLPRDVWTREQAARAAQDEPVVRELMEADVIVIGAPTYNFNISSQLKNWIDAIAKPGLTFRDTQDGPVGLLRGKCAYVVLTRGGIYRDTPDDIPARYLKIMLASLGITSLDFVYAEGLSRGGSMSANAFRNAEQEIARLIGPPRQLHDRRPGLSG